jgi:hypothetical protein
MVTMIVEMVQMNRQNIVNQKVERALEIYSLAITETAYLEFIFAMEITIVWITVTKIIDISAVS